MKAGNKVKKRGGTRKGAGRPQSCCNPCGHCLRCLKRAIEQRSRAKAGK